MKKLLAILLSLIMVFSLAACGSTFWAWLRGHPPRGIFLTSTSTLGLLFPCYCLPHHPAHLPAALLLLQNILCVFSLALYCLCDCPLAPVSCFLLPLPSTRRSPAQLLAQTGLDKYFSAYIHIFAFMWNMRPLRQIRNHSQRQ